jgi:NAD(P)-dependent dehydrogenase (short-subunit alcohol dehydrogenase family)
MEEQAGYKADEMKRALEGKVAVITGGNSGIGLASAKRFVAEGAFVFITGRRQAELDKAVKKIGKNVVAVRSDVSKLEDLDRLYEEVAAQKGKIDILFANAGIVETVETPAVTPEHPPLATNARSPGSRGSDSYHLAAPAARFRASSFS